jgi:hypothetical protein
MGKLHDAIVARLAAELEARTAWDEPPALYRLGLRSKQARLVDAEVPLDIWALARPPEVLDRLAGYMANQGWPLPGGLPPGWELHGMACRHEGWWVDVEMADRPAAKYTAAMAAEHRLADHPARVEIRMMYAVDRAGITYSSTLYRDQAEAETMIAYPTGRAVVHGPRVEEAMGGSDHLSVQPTGAVVEALDRMVTILTGATLPPRASSYLEDHMRGGRT